MDRRTMRRLNTARMMLEFIKAQPPSTDAGFNGLVAALEKLVAEADEVAKTQHTGQALQSAATRRRNELRRRTLRDQARYVVHVAQRAALVNPTAVGQIVMPPDNGPMAQFIIRAKALLDEAVSQKELLGSYGLTASALDDLQTALAEFDDETVRQHDGLRDHITARIELADIADQCMQISKALDGIFRQQFAANPELLGAWNSVRRVGHRAVHRHDDPGTDPVAPPAPSPAAG